MSRARWLGVAALTAAAGAGAWVGSEGLTASAPVRSQTAAVPARQPASAPARAATPRPATAVRPGETPMAERVAIVGFLNKRNGEARDLVMRPGQAYRVGEAIVRLRACEQTAPWEQDQLTGAFFQLDVQGADRRWRRSFSGWVFKERPALNVVPSALYDVWPKSCTMRFPTSGADTVTSDAATGQRASNARKSPRAGAAAPSPPAASPSADPSNTL